MKFQWPKMPDIELPDFPSSYRLQITFDVTGVGAEDADEAMRKALQEWLDQHPRCRTPTTGDAAKVGPLARKP